MTSETAHTIAKISEEMPKSLPKEVSSYISKLLECLSHLGNRIAELEAENFALKAENQELKARLSQNSQNSHKPPSSDGLKKPNRGSKDRSLRKKSGLPSGGQKGHQGSTLEMSNCPDEVKIHPVHNCQGCGSSLEAIEAMDEQVRQEFDMERPVIKCTEHRSQVKICPHCEHLNLGRFPDHITQPVQYGSAIKSFITYLNQYQLIPYNRITEMFQDLLGHSISEGTVNNTLDVAHDNLENFENGIKGSLQDAHILHHDETGVRVASKTNWLHIACTKFLTHYAVHKKRGQEAMDETGILPKFKGILIHDCWAPYFSYGDDHGLCDAHILRELIGVHESVEHKWALRMVKLLIDIKEQTDKNPTVKLSDHKIALFERKYASILENGFAEELATRPDPPPKKKRGRSKQTKAKNLLDRLDTHQRYVLAFMYDPEVPFDNNQGERDGRMAKLQQKISGCFRSEHGAKRFCRIRGYISTARKNGQPIFEALQGVFTGKPFVPPGVRLQST